MLLVSRPPTTWSCLSHGSVTPTLVANVLAMLLPRMWLAKPTGLRTWRVHCLSVTALALKEISTCSLSA